MTLTNNQLNSFYRLASSIDGSVYEDYSGRGMYGKSCMGITVDNLERSIFRIGRESCDFDFCEQLENFRTDNLGRDYIIYFPKIQKAIDGE